MDTRKAFKEMINQRAIYKTLGVTMVDVRNYRQYYKSGKLSTDKMIALLKKAGYTVKQEMEWNEPK